MTSLYRPLDVVETYSRIDGRRFWVRDEDGAWFWCVEYVGTPGRLTCACDDGEAHAETPDTEPECAHLRAVIEQRMADNQSSRPKAAVNAAAWVD